MSFFFDVLIPKLWDIYYDLRFLFLSFNFSPEFYNVVTWLALLYILYWWYKNR